MDHLRNMAVSSHRFKGQIQLIFGPMFSGKTTELLRRINRYRIANYNVVLLKYKHDVRYEKDSINTHDRLVVRAKKAILLKECLPECQDSDVIGIDEGQFFSDILEFTESLANCGKIVIVAALDATYEREPFGNLLMLVPKAENIVKLAAICVLCNKDAAFTRRRNSESVMDTVRSDHTSRLAVSTFQSELIGGSDKYMAVCRECYRQDLSTDNEVLGT